MATMTTSATGERCEKIVGADGSRNRARQCETAHSEDLGRWCAACFDRYIADLRADNDWMGGIDADGQPRAGFVDPANLEIINRALSEAAAADAVGPEPSPEEEAEILGRWLGSDGIAAAPRANACQLEREAFRRGYEAGWREFEEEEFARSAFEEERAEGAFGPPEDRRSDEELLIARPLAGYRPGEG